MTARNCQMEEDRRREYALRAVTALSLSTGISIVKRTSAAQAAYVTERRFA